MFKQYQAVQLKRAYLNKIFSDTPVKLKKGQRGVVLDVLSIPNVPIGYNVEFFDKNGETVAVTTLKEKDLAPIITKQNSARH